MNASVSPTLPKQVGTATVSANVATPHLDPVWDDQTLKTWLDDKRKQRAVVTLVYARYLCAFFVDGETSLHFADPEGGATRSLKTLARVNLLKRVEAEFTELQSGAVVRQDWSQSARIATEDDVRSWVAGRKSVFGQGRGRALSPAGAKLVWHQSAGRCMYRGCGADLGSTTLTTKDGAVGYLAHIVASDQDGPRGDAQDSLRLSDDPANVMLMCDEHHRLIDRIDVDGHKAGMLNQMRAEHVAQVESVLRSLTYPKSLPLLIYSDVANVKTNVSQRDMHAAILAQRLAPLSSREILRRTQRDDRLTSTFWASLLHEHELELRDLKTCAGGATSGHLGSEVLSVFPLHLVPVLILAGRIVGEAGRVEVFQYDAPNQTWKWNESAAPLQEGAFYLEGVPAREAQEVVLSMELTASVDERALPGNLSDRINRGDLPWIRIRAKEPRSDTIGHPDDLQQFTALAGQAIRVIQDQCRATRVHLLGVSPASTLFRFGQLLRPGHHSEYVVYDRPDRTQPFIPALSITGQAVSDVPVGVGPASKIIQLR
ncbi:SAVED domain-containing protein [Ralstonia wenshanensis]|uniref:SAVED domain-containing protein n=1 Tax=Ralstonia wenshanensis TaxID=2842456 RepID=UPI0021B41500|nr:SAVED domain-containing protein [Ralstonia wenshanensis]MCT7306241.1 SAVED domain-containing protein [Ralstonia wenshanensis]